MQLIYFHGKQPNFGDDINAILWPRLLPGLFDGATDEGFLGIGTLIGMPTPTCRLLHVFSTGAGYDAIETWRTERRIWCVRGPITARLLGAEPSAALTDGAILMPEVLGKLPEAATRSAVGVVPHWQSLRFPGWQTACDDAGFRLISPIDTPENVYAAIGGVGLVLTESLHGAILADAMGIPWIPFITTRNVSAMKWVDWCLSVGLTFSPAPVMPPSASAALAFGRPAREAGVTPHLIDTDAAMTEFRQRIAAHHRAAAAPALPARMRRAVSAMSRYSGVVNHALGYGCERTAAQLTELARLPGQLSLASRRADLRSAMLERLRAFERAWHTDASPASNVVAMR